MVTPRDDEKILTEWIEYKKKHSSSYSLNKIYNTLGLIYDCHPTTVKKYLSTTEDNQQERNREQQEQKLRKKRIRKRWLYKFQRRPDSVILDLFVDQRELTLSEISSLLIEKSGGIKFRVDTILDLLDKYVECTQMNDAGLPILNQHPPDSGIYQLVPYC